MIYVGIRELRDKLSAFVRLVREGETVLVTDRGKVVAELRRPAEEGPTRYPGLNREIREGRTRAAKPDPPADLYEIRQSMSGTLQDLLDLLDEERGGS